MYCSAPIPSPQNKLTPLSIFLFGDCSLFLSPEPPIIRPARFDFPRVFRPSSAYTHSLPFLPATTPLMHTPPPLHFRSAGFPHKSIRPCRSVCMGRGIILPFVDIYPYITAHFPTSHPAPQFDARTAKTRRTDIQRYHPNPKSETLSSLSQARQRPQNRPSPAFTRPSKACHPPRQNRTACPQRGSGFGL